MGCIVSLDLIENRQMKFLLNGFTTDDEFKKPVSSVEIMR